MTKNYLASASCFRAIVMISIVYFLAILFFFTSGEVQAQNYALQFDGSNDRVALPGSLIASRNVLTVELWFKTSSPGVLIGHQSTAYNGPSSSNPSAKVPTLYIGLDGKLRGQFWYSGGVNPITSSPSVNDDQWHHVALASDGSSQSLYLDGNLVGSRSGSVNNEGFGMIHNQFGVGANSGWPSASSTDHWGEFQGEIDELRLWSTARTQSEVQQFMNDVNVDSEADLLSVWHLDEGAGTLVGDSKGSNHATLNGASWITSGVFSTADSLQGTFTIGGTNPDYPDFTSAVSVLHNSVLAGPVIFNVRDGSYIEQLSIGEIDGASDTNTITFQSESGDSSGVILSYAATSDTGNYIIRLKGTDYLTLRGFTLQATGEDYGVVLNISDGANHNRIVNNHIIGRDLEGGYINRHTLIYYDQWENNEGYNHFIGNRIEDGLHGMYINDDQATGVLIRNNTFINQYSYGVEVYYVDALELTGNTFRANPYSDYYEGISLYYCNNGIRITKNRVYEPGEGIGIRTQWCEGSPEERALIANNFVLIGSSSITYSQGIYSEYSTYQDIFHNTVRLFSEGVDENVTPLQLDHFSDFHVRIWNNVFSNEGGGYAMFIADTTMQVLSDYNLLYTDGPFPIGTWDDDYSNLATWSQESGRDIHSIFADPFFVSDSSVYAIQLLLDNTGKPLSEVSEDIDGEVRDSLSPCIGADEFMAPPNDAWPSSLLVPLTEGSTPVRIAIRNNGLDTLQSLTVSWEVNDTLQAPYNWTGAIVPGDTAHITLGSYSFVPLASYNFRMWTSNPNGAQDSRTENDTLTVTGIYTALNGIYTIGGLAPDFPDFSAAVGVLNHSGVSGPLTFYVRDSVYEEQFSLGPIPGNTASNPITFRSESGDSTAVILRYNATQANNYVFQLRGADYITFRQFTFESLNNSYGRVLDIREAACHNHFSGNIFRGVVTSSNYGEYALVYSTDDKDEHNNFTNNLFENGSFALLYGGGAGKYEKGTQFKNNRLINQSHTGLSLRYQEAPVISGNVLEAGISRTYYYGINVYHCDSALQITSNRITGARGGEMIKLQNCIGSADTMALIANNFIQAGQFNGLNYGIYSDNSDYQNYYHNSINITSTYTGFAGSIVVRSNTANSIRLLNNIFMNSGGGYALYLQSPNAIDTSDHNDLYTTGTNLAFWNGNRMDLASLQVASGMDVNSVSADPLFTSATDLHVRQIVLGEAGTPLPQVTLDIDGELRNPATPDIGADEFISVNKDLKLLGLLSPVSGCALDSLESVTMIVQNQGLDTLSGFDLSYQLDNNPPVTENIGARFVTSGDTLHYRFSTPIDLSTYTSYTLYASVQDSGDTYPFNDSLEQDIVNSPPIALNVSPDRTICEGMLVLLSASGGTSYQWSTGAVSASIGVRPDTSTTYVVTASNTFGCSATDSIRVVVNPIPASPLVTAMGPTQFCQGDSVLLSSDISGNIAWSTGDTASSIYAKASGDYWVRHTVNGCTAYSNSVLVTVIPRPSIAIIQGGSTVCLGDSVTLTVQHAHSQNWSTGATTTSITVSPDSITSYWVTAVNMDSCLTTDSITIAVSYPDSLGVVSNMLPADSSTGLVNRVSFSWLPAVQATYYNLYVWPADDTVPPMPTVSGITGINYSYPGTLQYGQSYKWQVVSVNACSQMVSPVQQFSMQKRPDLQVTSLQHSQAYAGWPMEVTWTVTNTGEATTNAPVWYDRIWLSPDIDVRVGENEDILLDEVPNPGFLDTGQSYTQTRQVILPVNTTGTYHLFVISDNIDAFSIDIQAMEASSHGGRNHNKLPEMNERNNFAFTAINIQVPPPSDLQVTELLSPFNAFSGQAVNLSWVVTNHQATTLASSWSDKVYLSADTVFNASTAIELGSFAHSDILETDSSYGENATVSLPQGIQGTWYFYLVTDAANQVDEQIYDQNNVRRSAALEVVLTPPPDLIVTDIQVPATASNREQITVSWMVRNQAADMAGVQSWQDRIYLSTNPNDSLSTSMTLLATVQQQAQLSNLQSISAQRTVNIPDGISGPWYLYIQTNINEAVYEHDFIANNLSRSDTVVQILNPDLVVSTINIPDSALSGTSISLSWDVLNRGAGSLPAITHIDRVFLSRSPLYNADSVTVLATEQYSLNLASGTSVQRQRSINLPNGITGTWYVLVYTDFSNVVYEGPTDSSNISASAVLPIQLAPWADLQASAVQVADTLQAGGSFSLSATVSNQGIGTARGSSWSDFVYISDQASWDPQAISILTSGTYNDSLEVDSSYTTSLGATIPVSMSGTRYFYFHTDANNRIYEHSSDPANNISRSAAVYIKAWPQADFLLDSLSGAQTLATGSTATISWAVRNQGGPLYSQNIFWYDGLYLSTDSLLSGNDQLIDEWKFFGSTFGPDSGYAINNESYTFPQGIASGNYYLILVSDHKNHQLETDEGNNYQTLPVQVTLTPSSDLVLSSFSAPTQGVSGQPISVRWTVQNRGTVATAAGTWYDRVYLSSDFTIGSNDTRLGTFTRNASLAADSSYSDSIQVNLPVNASGNYVLLMRTDDSDREYEYQSEQNNIDTLLIQVSQPPPSDLVVNSVSIPDSARVSEFFTVQWTLQNIGANVANGNREDALYLSRDIVWGSDDLLLGSYQAYSNLTPLAQEIRSLSVVLPGVVSGPYYVIVRADVRNNLYEQNDTNNTGISSGSLYADMQVLPLHVWEDTTLANLVPLYYRLYIPDSLVDETMLLTLLGDSTSGTNELYLSHESLPTRTVHDYAHDQAFAGNQEVLVPRLKSGNWYLLVYGSTAQGNAQAIRLYAQKLNFEIRSVDASQGGNTGRVTVRLRGSKFQPGMAVRLEKAGLDTLNASRILYVDASDLFTTFDLDGKAIGTYDVVVETDSGAVARLPESFEVMTGLPPELLVDVDYPSSARVGRVIFMTINYTNAGNVDVPLTNRFIINREGAPLAFDVDKLGAAVSSLPLRLRERGVAISELRPGASGKIVVYTRTIRNSNEMRFLLVK